MNLAGSGADSIKSVNKPVDFSDIYQIAKDNLSPFQDKIEFIIDYSTNAIKNIHDNVDFVYIDANHDFEMVYKDLDAYYPIIKNGGVIGGHDYCPIYPGVARAIDKYFDYPDMICHSNDNTEWWRIKDKDQ